MKRQDHDRGNQHTGGKSSNPTLATQDRGKSYTLSRLKRQSPKLFKAVCNGKMSADGRLGPMAIELGSKRMYRVQELVSWVNHGCPPRERWSEILSHEEKGVLAKGGKCLPIESFTARVCRCVSAARFVLDRIHPWPPFLDGRR